MLDKLNILTRIIEKIRRFPVTFESMKEWIRYENIEISDRTLYRYLNDAGNLRLNDGQIVILNGDANKKTWKFEYDNSDNELKEEDIINLLLLKGFFPNSFSKDRKKSVEKIEEIVYKAHSKSKFEYNMQTFPKDQIAQLPFGEYHFNECQHEKINRLVWATLHHRKIHLAENRFVVDNFNGEGLLPMQIIYHKGAIYLMCLSTDDKLHAIDINQLNEFDVLNVPFDINKYEHVYETLLNKRFGIEANFNETIYDIVLHFSSETGKSACARHWHSSQNSIELPNGNWEMQLNCGINKELIDWIIMWRNDVEILKPATLIYKISEHLLSCLKSHRQLLQSLIYFIGLLLIG